MAWQLQVKTIETDENFFVSVGDLVTKEHAGAVVNHYHRAWVHEESGESFEDYLIDESCDFFGKVEQ